MTPPRAGQLEILALRVLAENGTGQARFGRLPLGNDDARRRQPIAELLRMTLHRGADKHHLADCAGQKHPLRGEIGRQVRMPLQMILGKIGPQHRIGPEKLLGWLGWSLGCLTRPEPCSASELIGAFEDSQKKDAAGAKAALPQLQSLWLAGPEGKLKKYAPLDELIQKAKAAKLDGLDLEKGFPIDSAFVQKVHGAGLKLYTWTVDDPEVARKEAAAGVEGITTNRPGWMREQLAATP